MTAWLCAVGGIAIGLVIGALGFTTYLLSKFTGEPWWKVWR